MRVEFVSEQVRLVARTNTANARRCLTRQLHAAEVGGQFALAHDLRLALLLIQELERAHLLYLRPRFIAREQLGRNVRFTPESGHC
jgi:hypothetical protein